MDAKMGEASGAGTTGIRHTTEILLKNPDMASTWLRLADEYMQAYANNPQSFILPKEHAFLKPVIDSYSDRLEGFVHYLVGVRDSMERKSGAWERMQNLYRKVMGRHTQQVRRERSDRAIAKAEEKYGETDFHTRLRWAAKLEHEWAKRRLAFLSHHRAKTENNRLNSEDRAELLASFWCEIDTEINNGEVPPWS